VAPPRREVPIPGLAAAGVEATLETDPDPAALRAAMLERRRLLRRELRELRALRVQPDQKVDFRHRERLLVWELGAIRSRLRQSV
jgi:hypothetical protein